MAKILGISRKNLSKIINERGSITPDMNLRLSRAFNTTAWLNLKQNYDLWNAERLSKYWKKVKPIPLHLLHSEKKINSEQII
ncbi:MAG: HigA family addiction module antitoxin [Thermodesulfobacteriota bacterium]|nr:HigA family addiction module antitoxin [Thermodesulfobacteriota bacterium]